MNERLKEIIKHTGKSQIEFADEMGWTPQYLNKLIKDGGIGIKPIVSVLEKYQEIDARWLLLGEGLMLGDSNTIIKDKVFKLLQIEQYMVVMAADELQQVQNGRTDFPEETLQRWKDALDNYRREQHRRFQEFNERQKEKCRQKQAK